MLQWLLQMPVVSPIHIGAGIPGRPLGLHGNSGDFTLGSAYNRVRSLAVAKETGGRKESGGGNREIRKTWAVLCEAGVRMRPLWRADGSGPVRPSPSLPPLTVTKWTRPLGGRSTEASDPPLPQDPSSAHKAPPPDASPPLPRSPRALGCCLRVAAAARGAGCRRRCCRWT